MPILNGITKNVDNLGKIGGALMALGAAGSYGSIGIGDVIQKMISSAIKDLHAPNLTNIVYDLSGGVMAEPLKNSIMLALAGEALDAVGYGKKWADLMKKAGWNAAVGVVLTDVALRCTVWHSPNEKQPTFTEKNFSMAPLASSYGY